MSSNVVIPEQDLPIWMRQARRGVDWGAIIALILGLAAAWPFVAQSGLPRTNASEHTVFQTANLSQDLLASRIYSRWSAHAEQGYGAPIPHYYPQGAAYAASLINVLVVNQPVDAVRLTYVATFMLAASMIYSFVKRETSAAAAILASALFLASPYPALTAPHVLGDLSGMVVMALGPSLLWALSRLMDRRVAADHLLVALITAGLLLTDPRQSLPAYGLALAFVAWKWRHHPDRTRALAMVASALLAGLLLAAFYWLPALLEGDQVTWRPANVGAEPLQLSMSGLFVPPLPIDSRALLPVPQLSLGLIAPLLAVVSGLASSYRRRLGLHGLFVVVGLVLLLIGITLAPAAVDLLGMMSLCFAIGGSGVVHTLQRNSPRIRRIAFAAIMAAVLLAQPPAWAGITWSADFGGISGLDQVRYERAGYGTPGLPAGSAIPTTLPTSTQPDRYLLNSYQTGTPQRLNPEPIGGAVSVLGETSHSSSFQLSLRQETPISITRSFFPGWRAELDGQPVRLSMDPDTGLLQTRLGRLSDSTLAVWLGPTPIRSLSWAISGAAMVLLMLVTWERSQQPAGDDYDDSDLLPVHDVRLLMIVVAGLIALTAISSTQANTAERSGPPADSTALHSRSDAGLEAIAFHSSHHAQAGDALDVTLYWQASRALTTNYRVRLRLIDTATGTVWAQDALRHPGYYPTRRWPRGRYVRDAHQLHIPAEAASGAYIIMVEVYDCQTSCAPDDRLTFFSPDGDRIGASLTLPQVITID